MTPYKTIKSVSGYKIIDSKLYYTLDDALYKEFDKIIEDVEGYSFWKLNSSLYYFNESTRFLQQENKTVEILTPLFVDSIYGSRLACKNNFRRENRKWHWHTSIFDIKSASIIVDLGLINFQVLYLNDSIIVGYYEANELICFDLESKAKEWQLSLSKLFFGSKYKKLIATENDSLIIGLTDSRILKIDLNRGEIIFNWHNVPGFNKSQFFKEVLPEADYFHFDSSRNNMIAFFASYIFEIDTESGDIKFENVKEKLEEHRFNSFKLCNSVNPKNESYLVTGHADLEKYPNVDLSGILSIKKSTLDIESSYIFEETGLGTNTVLSRDQDIFVKDLNNRLHWLKNC